MRAKSTTCSAARAWLRCPEDAAPEDDIGRMERHIAACPECRRACKRELAFRRLLRELPVPPPTAGFAARALREATRPRRGAGGIFAAGFASAAMLVGALWLGMGHLTRQSEAPVAAIEMTLDQPRTIRLVFRAPADLPEAQLRMELSGGLELAGYPGMRELTWPVSLRAGDNVLTLPVIARKAGEAELKTKIAYEGSEKTFRVQMNVEASRESKGAGAGLG